MPFAAAAQYVSLQNEYSWGTIKRKKRDFIMSTFTVLVPSIKKNHNVN